MENRGDKDENLYYIITGAYQEIPAEAGYFHATYRQEHPVQKGRTYTIVDGNRRQGTICWCDSGNWYEWQQIPVG